MCASSLALLSQSLEISSRPLSPEKATVVISIVLPKEKDVLGIQWETAFPAQQMSVDDNRPEVSDAAKAAGKSLHCSNKKVKDVQSYTCILIGGQKPLKNGPIAVFNVHVLPDAKGNTTVRAGHAEAVTKDLRKLSLQGAESRVMGKDSLTH
jgi:hypothetical protein